MTGVAQVGDVLAGKYRVNRVLGVGGMGMVVEALHLELEQLVALKFMLPEAMQSKHAVERFLREAKAAVLLRSEHVCRVLDVGKLEGGAPYIVMEYMDGHDFAELIRRRGPLPVEEAVDLVLQALEGVAEAHAKQIVHRDLKPANLFVAKDSDSSPLVKVLDFGISKSAVSGSATKTGDILGSPSYMAPEQMMSSKNVDGRADVWAFGVILYEAVTGQLPFTGESLPVLCMSVIHDEPLPPIHHRPDLDPGFDAVIQRCLDKRLEHRFRDVQSLANALAQFGGPTASTAAARITRMRGRAMSPAIVETVAPTVRPVATGGPVATPGGTPRPPDGDSMDRHATHGHKPGQISTLQSSAGSLEIAGSPPSRRAWTLLAGSAVAIAAGVLTFTLISSRSGPSTRPSAAPPTPASSAPAPTEPAPSPPPTAATEMTTVPPPVPSTAPTSGAGSGSSHEASAEPVSAAGAPAIGSASSAAPKPAPKPKPKPKPAVKPQPQPVPSKACDPPYVLDATGKRIYKQECL